MKRLTAVALLAALAAGGVAGAGEAPDEATIEEQLAALRAAYEQQSEQIEAMNVEIAELRTQSGDHWLTERRAEEIRALVHEVLTDADTRASLLQNGLMAGWSDHFFLASPDGRFKLQFEGQMQFRWIYNYHDTFDTHRHGFENTRTKLTFSGHVFNPDLTYLIRANYLRNNGGFLLQDAWLRHRLNNDWTVRIGQFKLPFTREELVDSARQLAVERSLINQNTNTGRSQGVEFTYTADDWKIMVVPMHDGAQDNLGGYGSVGGGTMGANTTALSEDVEWSLTGRYERLLAGSWGQFDDFTSPPGEEYGLLFGLAVHFQQDESGTGFFGVRNESNWYSFTTDLSAEWGGANLFGSFTYAYADNSNTSQVRIYGAMIQGGYYITPKVEVYGRFEYGWWEFVDMDFSDMFTVTTGVNYYLDGHDMKWTTDLGVGLSKVENNWDNDEAGWRPDRDHAEPQVVFRTQFQLLF